MLGTGGSGGDGLPTDKDNQGWDLAAYFHTCRAQSSTKLASISLRVGLLVLQGT